MKKVSFKGVIIGSVTDILTTNLLTIPVIVYVTASHNLAAVPKDQIASALTQILQNDPFLFSIQLLLGSLCSVLGGYISARIAKRNELLNGALASFLCVSGGLYALLFSATSVPLWQHLLGLVVSPALATFGGYIRLKTIRSKANAKSDD